MGLSQRVWNPNCWLACCWPSMCVTCSILPRFFACPGNLTIYHWTHSSQENVSTNGSGWSFGGKRNTPNPRTSASCTRTSALRSTSAAGRSALWWWGPRTDRARCWRHWPSLGEIRNDLPGVGNEFEGIPLKGTSKFVRGATLFLTPGVLLVR